MPARCAASLGTDQRVNATPCVSGRARATATIRSRCSGVVFFGRPPRYSGSNDPNPRSLNAWMTLRTCDSSVRALAAICDAGIPVEDANKITARWRLDWYLAFREIDFSRAPSWKRQRRDEHLRGTHRHLHARDTSGEFPVKP